MTAGSNTPCLRVAVIGLGLIGRQRAEALQHIDGATLVATVDPAGVPLAAVHYASLDELPAESYDAAIVAVPHDRAVEAAAHVLSCRRPVLIEKPLGVNPGDARSVEALSHDAPLPSFVGYNYRYMPSVRELLDRLRSGWFGELRSVDMLIGHGGHPGSASGWKLDPKRAGGGVILDPGVHLIDLLLQIAPGAACETVVATSGFWGTGIEEDVTAVFRAGSLIATLRASHLRWVNGFRIEIFGEDGYGIAEGRGGNYGPMSLRLGRRWAWAEAGAGSQHESEEVADYGTLNESLLDELVDVVAAWRSGRAPVGGLHPATMAEGLAVAELCGALYERLALD